MVGFTAEYSFSRVGRTLDAGAVAAGSVEIAGDMRAAQIWISCATVRWS